MPSTPRTGDTGWAHGGARRRVIPAEDSGTHRPVQRASSRGGGATRAPALALSIRGSHVGNNGVSPLLPGPGQRSANNILDLNKVQSLQRLYAKCPDFNYEENLKQNEKRRQQTPTQDDTGVRIIFPGL